MVHLLVRCLHCSQQWQVALQSFECPCQRSRPGQPNLAANHGPHYVSSSHHQSISFTMRGTSPIVTLRVRYFGNARDGVGRVIFSVVSICSSRCGAGGCWHVLPSCLSLHTTDRDQDVCLWLRLVSSASGRIPETYKRCLPNPRVNWYVGCPVYRSSMESQRRG